MRILNTLILLNCVVNKIYIYRVWFASLKRGSYDLITDPSHLLCSLIESIFRRWIIWNLLLFHFNIFVAWWPFSWWFRVFLLLWYILTVILHLVIFGIFIWTRLSFFVFFFLCSRFLNFSIWFLCFWVRIIWWRFIFWSWSWCHFLLRWIDYIWSNRDIDLLIIYIWSNSGIDLLLFSSSNRCHFGRLGHFWMLGHTLTYHWIIFIWIMWINISFFILVNNFGLLLFVIHNRDNLFICIWAAHILFNILRL